MQLLKMIFGLGLVISLALPLSTCSGVVEEGSDIQAERVERYVLSEGASVSEWLWALTFAFPLGVSMVLNKRNFRGSEILSLISVVPASFVLWAHSVTGKLAIGGILAVLSIVCFICVSVVGLTRFTRKN